MPDPKKKPQNKKPQDKKGKKKGDGKRHLKDPYALKNLKSYKLPWLEILSNRAKYSDALASKQLEGQLGRQDIWNAIRKAEGGRDRTLSDILRQGKLASKLTKEDANDRGMLFSTDYVGREKGVQEDVLRNQERTRADYLSERDALEDKLFGINQSERLFETQQQREKRLSEALLRQQIAQRKAQNAYIGTRGFPKEIGGPMPDYKGPAQRPQNKPNKPKNNQGKTPQQKPKKKSMYGNV